MNFIWNFLVSLPQRLGRISSIKIRREIDGLRFFAILPVVLGHIIERVLRYRESLGNVDPSAKTLLDWFCNQGAGVVLFFAISGYIIAMQFKSRRAGVTVAGELKSYYWNRLTRILPPYYIVVVGTFVLIAIFHFDTSGARSFDRSSVPLHISMLSSLVYAHGWFFGQFPRLYPPGWTLELEIQFYCVAPFLIYLLATLSNLHARLLVGLTVLVVSTYYCFQIKLGVTSPYWYFTIARFFPYFWLGIVLLDVQELFKRFDSNPTLLSVLGLAGLFGYLFMHWPALGHPEDTAAAGAVLMGCIVLMFIGVFSDRAVLWKICANPYVSLIGSACYSIYLTHLQAVFVTGKVLYKHLHISNIYAFTIVSILVQLVLLLVVGLVFYYFCERPFMRKNWPTYALQRLNALVRRRRSEQAIEDISIANKQG